MSLAKSYIEELARDEGKSLFEVAQEMGRDNTGIFYSFTGEHTSMFMVETIVKDFISKLKDAPIKVNRFFVNLAKDTLPLKIISEKIKDDAYQQIKDYLFANRIFPTVNDESEIILPSDLDEYHHAEVIRLYREGAGLTTLDIRKMNEYHRTRANRVFESEPTEGTSTSMGSLFGDILGKVKTVPVKPVIKEEDIVIPPIERLSGNYRLQDIRKSVEHHYVLTPNEFMERIGWDVKTVRSNLYTFKPYFKYVYDIIEKVIRKEGWCQKLVDMVYDYLAESPRSGITLEMFTNTKVKGKINAVTSTSSDLDCMLYRAGDVHIHDGSLEDRQRFYYRLQKALGHGERTLLVKEKIVDKQPTIVTELIEEDALEQPSKKPSPELARVIEQVRAVEPPTVEVEKEPELELEEVIADGTVLTKEQVVVFGILSEELHGRKLDNLVGISEQPYTETKHFVEDVANTASGKVMRGVWVSNEVHEYNLDVLRNKGLTLDKDGRIEIDIPEWPEVEELLVPKVIEGGRLTDNGFKEKVKDLVREHRIDFEKLGSELLIMMALED